jgi:hypothetical protein
VVHPDLGMTHVTAGAVPNVWLAGRQWNFAMDSDLFKG